MGPCVDKGVLYRPFNYATILHPINMDDWGATGVQGVATYGANRPILSAHPDGAHALFCDGSVHFLIEDLNIQILHSLGNRDDGHVVSF
jgi:prepilin-type processing-associated H-X9-DG protein